jgi:S-(hydroxymethyl)glutathione dehydrogenase / alcohol dehydrogenase
MDVSAAVAVAAGKPLVISTVRLNGPREGEVLVDQGHGRLPHR